MNGAPAKPIRGTSSSATSRRTVSITYGVSSSGWSGRRRSRSAGEPNGSATTGPTPGDDLETDADGRDGHDDVGEEDRGVDAVTPHRLQRDLGGELGIADRLEDAGRPAQPSVLGQRPARLAHEPHRHLLDGLAPAGPQEGRVGERHGTTLQREGAEDGAPAGPAELVWCARAGVDYEIHP